MIRELLFRLTFCIGYLSGKLILNLFYFGQLNFFKLPIKMEMDVVNRPQKSKKRFAIKILQFEKLKVLSSNYPRARSGHRMVCDQDGNLYSFGGYNSDLIDNTDLDNDEDWIKTKPLFRELWRYNISTNEWVKIKTKGEFPKQLASHCTSMLNDHLLISYGGTAVPFEAYSSNSLYLLNLISKKWYLLNDICKPESQFPSRKYGQALCIDEKNECIYVSGGTDGFFFSIDVHCYNFKTKLWSQLANSLDVTVQPRYRHEMVLFENRLFIFGGGSTDVDCELEILPVFDLNTRSWNHCSTIGFEENNLVKYPSARRCHQICRYKDFVFLLGGLSNKKICGDLWRFDLQNKKWILLVKQMPIPVYFHAASCSRYGQLTTFGGITSKGNSHTRSKKLFSIWIDIPPLKEIAWRSVLYYNDNLRHKSDSELIELGLPNSYIKRLKN